LAVAPAGRSAASYTITRDTTDRVAAENYYQHAEHYFRVNDESRTGNSAGTSNPIDRGTAHAGFAAEPSETAIVQGLVAEASETAVVQGQPRPDDD
jgi:Domain of unknown function (DUF4167)